MMIWENSWMSKSQHPRLTQKMRHLEETQAPFVIPEPSSSSCHPFEPARQPPTCTLGMAVGKVRGGLGGDAKIIRNAGRVRLLFVGTDLIQFNVQCIYISVYTDNYSIYIALQSIANTDYILLLHNPLSLCRRWLVSFGERYCHKTPFYIGTSLRWKLTTWLKLPF